MSNVIRSLIVRVGADTKEFSTSMKNVSKDLTNTGKSISKTGASLSRAGATMTRNVTLPIVGLGAASAKAAIDFESAFAGVRKTVDATESEFAALSKGIRDMSKEIPASAVEIAGVAEAAGQLGIETKSILGFTRVMTDLGVATNMSATEAATSLARLANITQMPQDQFDKLGSVIVALGNNLATTESEIVDMGLRLAGAGKQVGLTEAKILSLAGALSSVGIESQAGGSAMSKVMVNMQLAVETGGKKLEHFARVAGMAANEFAEAYKKDAAGALVDFVKGLETAEERGVSAIKVLDDMGIKEVRMRDALLRMAGAGDVLADSIKLGTKAWEENNALTKEAEERYKTTESQLQLAKNRMMDAAIVAGEALAPHIIKIADAVANLTEKFSALSPEQQEMILKMAAAAAVMGPVLKLTGGLTKGFGSLFETAGKVTAGIGRFSKALGTGNGIIKSLGIMLGPGGVVLVGLAALATAAYAIYKNWDKIKTTVTGAIAKVKEFFKTDKEATIQRGGSNYATSQNSITKRGGQSKAKWNAAGAIFTRPTVLPTMAGYQGFGEAGPEVVLPLSKLRGMLGEFKQTVNHTGTIQVKGVNNRGELIGVVDIVMDELRRDSRR